jgi:hypothetical protein
LRLGRNRFTAKRGSVPILKLPDKDYFPETLTKVLGCPFPNLKGFRTCLKSEA